jgi:hypothetical protein
MTIEELKEKLSDMQRANTDSGYYRLDIGRFKNVRLRDIPLGYLAWMRGELAKTPSLAADRLFHLNRYLDSQ